MNDKGIYLGVIALCLLCLCAYLHIHSKRHPAVVNITFLNDEKLNVNGRIVPDNELLAHLKKWKHPHGESSICFYGGGNEPHRRICVVRNECSGNGWYDYFIEAGGKKIAVQFYPLDEGFWELFSSAEDFIKTEVEWRRWLAEKERRLIIEVAPDGIWIDGRHFPSAEGLVDALYELRPERLTPVEILCNLDSRHSQLQDVLAACREAAMPNLFVMRGYSGTIRLHELIVAQEERFNHERDESQFKPDK